MKKAATLFLCAFALSVAAPAAGEPTSRAYEPNDPIPVWTHSVSPFANPQERYRYFSLPLCVPSAGLEKKKSAGLAESILGYDFIQSLHDVQFKKGIESAVECEGMLTEVGVQALERAVREQYWYEWFVDELPVWGLVGELAESPATGAVVPYVYTHRELLLSHDARGHVVAVALNASELRQLRDFAPAAEQPLPLRLTYAVRWALQGGDSAAVSRFERYYDRAFFEHQIHWFSLFNSAMLALFLAGVVAMVLMRTVHRDFGASVGKKDVDVEAQATSVQSPDPADVEDSGWKQVAGDVFRPPPRQVQFSAIVGTGAQLFAAMAVIFLSGALGHEFSGRAELLGWFIFLYVACALIGGFRSGSEYAAMRGRSWIRTAGATAVFFPACAGLVWSLVNSVGSAYNSLASAPFSAQLAAASLWLFGVLPLTFVGTLIGRHWGAAPPSAKVNPIPGPIPKRRWYQSRLVLSMLGALLPFGALFIELYFASAGIWHYKYYYVYGFAFVVFLSVTVVTACVAIVTTYYLLNAEDCRWQWTSVQTGVLVGVYVFAYGVFFYDSRTQMSGSLQAACFFGTSFIAASVIGLACASVGHYAAAWFVRRIFATGKTD